MTDIPNTEYITVNKDGIFVGGKRTIKYRGTTIWRLDEIQQFFTELQELNKKIMELHVLSSETNGVVGKTGTPSGKHGPYAWCRVIFKDGSIGSWVFEDEYCSKKDCAECCANNSAAWVVQDNEAYSAILNIQQTNKEYVTINAKGIFVGGKRAKKYRGQGMYFAQDAVNFFKDFQNQNKNVAELHILSSETSGTSLKSGKPSRKHGKYPWCRVKFDNGSVGPWVPDSSYEYSSASNCAYYCVRYGALNVCQNVDFRSAVLEKSQTQEMKKLKKVDLSVFEGKTLELNGYEIVVRKLAETQQIKR